MTEPTLDAVALNVLQLEPDDRDELARARDQLVGLARANAIPASAQPFVAGAVAALTRLADGTAANPAVAMRDAGRSLQRAVEAAPGRAEVRPAAPVRAA